MFLAHHCLPKVAKNCQKNPKLADIIVCSDYISFIFSKLLLVLICQIHGSGFKQNMSFQTGSLIAFTISDS